MSIIMSIVAKQYFGNKHRNWIAGDIYITNGYNQLFNQIIKSSFTELGSTNYITNFLIMSNIHGKRCT